MSTKTIQVQFRVGGVLTDLTSCVLRDPTGTFGVRRTDTLEIIAAAGTTMVHDDVGTYHYTFVEPQPGLSYEYWTERVYAGNTYCTHGVMDTVPGGTVSAAPTTYKQMGIDAVACGDATLAAFLSGQADLIWALNVRRGVSLDLLFQYYTLGLLDLAMDHVRMLIDTETGNSAMTDAAQSDALNTSSSNASTARARSSSFTESSSSSQNFSRTAARSSSSSSVLHSSNSASRNASSSDTSTIAQSSSGSSSRTQSGSSTAMGTLTNPNTGALDGTSGVANSSFAQNAISTVKHEVKAVAFVTPAPPLFPADPIVNDGTLTSSFISVNGHATGLVTASWMTGNSGVGHKMTPSTLGRINPGGPIDADGAPGDYATQSFADAGHGRSMIGSQTGTGSSTFTSSGTRVNNRVGSSVSASNSSMTGNASSSMTSSAHDDQTRSAASASHSESSFNSSMTASSTRHSEMAATDAMSSSALIDREYYSQIFEGLQAMWDATKEEIKQLEAQMLLAKQYLVNKLTVKTPQAQLVGQVALTTLPTLTQRPGIKNTLDPFTGTFNRWVVR